MATARKRRLRRGSVEVLPSGSVRVRVRGRCQDGRPFDLTATVTQGATLDERKAEARRVEVQLMRRAQDYEAGLASPDVDMTLAAWWARDARGRGVRRAELSAWKGPCRPLWILPLVALDDARLRGWVEGMARKGYSASYQRNAWSLVRATVGRAREARIIGALPWVKGAPVPPDSATQRAVYFTAAEQAAIYDAARAIDAAGGEGSLALRIEWSLQTGDRPIESCWATPTQVERVDDEVGCYRRRPAKGSAASDVVIPGELASRVLAHFGSLPVRARELGLLFPRLGTRAKWRPRYDEIKRGARLEAVGKHWITQAEVARVRELSGVATFSPYGLRHTRFTTLGSQLTDRQLMSQSGHKSPRMVGRYVHSRGVELPASLLVPMVGDGPGGLVSGSTVGAVGPAANDGLDDFSRSVVGELMGAEGRGRRVGATALDSEFLARAVEGAARIIGWGDGSIGEGAKQAVERLGPLAALEVVADLEAAGALGAGLDPSMRIRVRRVAAELRAHAQRRGVARARIAEVFANDSADMPLKEASRFTPFNAMDTTGEVTTGKDKGNGRP